MPREEVPETRAQGEAEPLHGIAGTADGGADAREVRLHTALHEGEQQRVLGPIAVMEAAGMQARRLGDRAHGRGLEPLRAEEARGRIEDAVLHGVRSP